MPDHVFVPQHVVEVATAVLTHKTLEVVWQLEISQVQVYQFRQHLRNPGWNG